ncbi:unnamed protein product [Chilo suppressalis]|uniref:RING-type domain-containing protein n=1 Tax=Chilo suppressalis TaxID=168631 RepID=A0ABN8B3F6_CHISP|nr:unnamed protein product [Chilo suppressalis]
MSRQEHPRPENAVNDVLTWNSLQITSPRYLNLSLPSDVFPWTPLTDDTLLLDQLPVEMPLEPRNQGMYRSLERIYTERMDRYQPNYSSLRDEESVDQRTLIEAHGRRRSAIIKRPVRNHSINQEVYSNPVISDNDELQIITSNDGAGYPSRFTQWQADEPQIIITSDIQMQTDDGDANYEVTFTVNPSSTAGFSSSRRVRQIPHPEADGRRLYFVSSTDITSSSVSNAIPSYQNGHPANNVTDRGTQMSPEPYDNNEVYENNVTDLNPGNSENVALSLETLETINLDSESPDTQSLHPTNSREITREDLHSIKPMLNYFSPKSVGVSGLNAASFGPYEMHVHSAPVPALPAPTLEARQVANRVIRHARSNRTLDGRLLNCLDCDHIPVLPVTGQCGHTRCTMCIQNNGSCTCGVEAPTSLHVNTVVQYLIRKMLPHDLTQRDSPNSWRRDETLIVTADATCPSVMRRRRRVRIRRNLKYYVRIFPYINERMPMLPQDQFEYARRLVTLGRYRDAAPHFARVAASYIPLAHTARRLLAQLIVVLAEGRDPRRITRDLFKSVRLQSAASWIRTGDLECVLCYSPYTKPVTTPCGHTYCRTCIEQALDYRKACALCSRPLNDFNLATAKETTFVRAALEAIGAYGPPLPPDPDVIPIFVCTVAFPCISCPLLIFDPRYWLMIRRVLESGSRKFGMVAYDKDKDYSDYGTILEVCDCVQLQDGRSLLSTVGVSRFRVIERHVRDGCDVARIQPLTDITPTDEFVMLEMRLMGSQVLCKALVWLNSMNKTVRQEIETSFGQIPRSDDVNEDWCVSPDGPAWLWWLIAILPLRSEIKILILSTKNLLKRLMAVSRTLDAIDQVAITTTSTSDCEIRSALTNAEEWLERGS